MEGVLGLFAERVFGPDHQALLTSDMARANSLASKDKQSRVRSLHNTIDQIDTKIDRQIRNLERDDNPTGTIYRRVQGRIFDLEAEKKRLGQELESLEHQSRCDETPELIERLPRKPPTSARSLKKL